MIVLCEECFPSWENYEVYTIVPMSPCVECGATDDRMHDGMRTAAFPTDPRIQPAGM